MRFQFHKGAIRTMQEFIEDCLTLENFNSIKVRLELVFYCTPFDSMKNFNSIKVRLELEMVKQIIKLLLYLNSIKVRLEHKQDKNAQAQREISIP